MINKLTLDIIQYIAHDKINTCKTMNNYKYDLIHINYKDVLEYEYIDKDRIKKSKNVII